MPAFHPQDRPDPSAPELAPHVVRGKRERQPVGILRDHPARYVDLLELEPRVTGVLRLAGNVHRPELAADSSLPEAVQIGVSRRAYPEIIRLYVTRAHLVFPDDPRQIVVPVHERRASQHRSEERRVGKEWRSRGSRW